jgi:poly(3-hydroxybutyrate) depolymerase
MLSRTMFALALAGCSSSGGGMQADDQPVDDAGIDTGGDPILGTAGCGKASTIATNMYVARSITVGGGARDYFIRVPTGYDPARPYPVIYQQHGCSSGANRETNNVPLDTQVGANAIIVRGKAAGQCWDTAMNGPDIAYWDAMVADVEAAWCIDAAKRYATGYSSGSFMTHRLGCIRADKLRGIATIAGGQAESNCPSTVGALLIHDLNDNTVNISASIAARDSHLTRNGCDKIAPPTATDHPPCVAYSACAAGKPVVWCQTTGKDHSRQDQLAGPIFWDFLSTLD